MSSPDPQSSDSPSTIDSETLGTDNPGEASRLPERNGEEGAEEGDEEEVEEEGECGFCLFMKGGGCRDEFVAWELCVQDAEKNEEDVVDKCFDATAALRKCMEAHSDYYEPILRAEKAAEEEVAKELEEEGKKLGANS
ncbi:Peptidyl-prolyl cis-trans isomerase [Psidium guajava]|nr:Peptidyl-prolyl cis-trans isomerase [Psidium guajava]